MSLYAHAVEALESTGTVQGFVRETLAEIHEGSARRDEIKAEITEEMSKFKQWSEDTYLPTQVDRKDVPAGRKRVNNVINDVSRICRAEAGFSVQLTSRKGGYKYHAVDAPPGAITKHDSSHTPNKVEKISHHCKLYPVQTMVEMFREYDREKLGTIFAKAKRRLDEENNTCMDKKLKKEAY